MKKLVLSFLLIAFTGTALLAQTIINDINAEKRAVSGYHGIDVATGIELRLTAGNAEEVAVSAATTEFRDKIVTRVENGILKIYYETKTGSINKTKENKDLKAYVSYKALDLLQVTTGAKVKINGVLKSASISMEVNTGALVDGEVTVSTGAIVSVSAEKELQAKASTGGSVKYKGSPTVKEIKRSTGGSVNKI